MTTLPQPTAYQRAVIAKQLVQKHGLVFVHNKTRHTYKIGKRINSRTVNSYGMGDSEHTAMCEAINYLNHLGKIDWTSLEVHL